MESQEQQRAVSTIIIGGVTLAAMLGASLLPEVRLWGMASWAHVPPIPLAIAVGITAIVLLAGLRIVPKVPREVQAGRGYLFGVCGAVLGAAALFFVFRTKAHFLGDGYTVLSLLTRDNPLIKMREIGESMMHVWVKNLSGLEGEEGALFSFRFLSIFAGGVLAAAAAWTAARLFGDTWRRVLFIAGFMTGGYALLFFGYVENYSLFVASVGIYALLGVLVARGQLVRWWLLIPLAAAIFFHVLGVTLLPSTVYLLLAPTGIGRRIENWSLAARVALIGLLGLGFVGAAFVVGGANVFFRYSLVPPIEGPFSVHGYTLLSLAHIADWLNLVMLLLPGAGLLVLVLLSALKSHRPHGRDTVFLIVLTFSTLGAVFLFDPKLGMPRDWDLFSFAGIGPVMLLYLLALDPRRALPSGMRLAWVAVGLALFSLSGRVVAVNSPPMMIARFNSYLELDPKRDRNAHYLLITYYEKQGDSAAADRTRREWRAAFPLQEKLDEALRLQRINKLTEARVLFEEIVREDPSHADAWAGFGWLMLRLTDADSAIACLDMALGLNPYHASASCNRGLAHLQLGNIEQAITDFKWSLEVDPAVPTIVYNLAVAYRQAGRHEEAEEQITRMAAMPNKAVSEHLRLSEWYAAGGRVDPAIAQLREALGKGADTASVRGLLEQYPAVAQALRR